MRLPIYITIVTCLRQCSSALLVLLFFFYVAASVISVVKTGSVGFTFPSQADLNFEGDAYFQSKDVIQRTKNQAEGSLADSFGWVSHSTPIPLWDDSSRALANFTTHFRFIIGRGNDVSTGFGDGLAFFLAPFDLQQPWNAWGGGIGLFNDTTFAGSPYQMVAVEFDTYQNEWDTDDNHVGIDVNTVFSNVTFSLSNASSANRSAYEDLKNGKEWDAWVDYNVVAKKLLVFLSYNPGVGNDLSKPGIPILSYDLDLSQLLPQNVKVGFSASTGFATETLTLRYWNFSSQLGNL